jgi:hypothetical protein
MARARTLLMDGKSILTNYDEYVREWGLCTEGGKYIAVANQPRATREMKVKVRKTRKLGIGC